MDIPRTARRSSPTTQPESFIRFPLTPHKSNEKSAPSKPRKQSAPSAPVQRVFAEIKSRGDGRPTSEEPWLAFRLDVNEYQELQRLLVADDDLHDFVENKLRYGGHILHWFSYKLTCTDPTTFHWSRSLYFECPLAYMKYSYPLSPMKYLLSAATGKVCIDEMDEEALLN